MHNTRSRRQLGKKKGMRMLREREGGSPLAWLISAAPSAGAAEPLANRRGMSLGAHASLPTQRCSAAAVLWRACTSTGAWRPQNPPLSSGIGYFNL